MSLWLLMNPKRWTHGLKKVLQGYCSHSTSRYSKLLSQPIPALAIGLVNFNLIQWGIWPDTGNTNTEKEKALSFRSWHCGARDEAEMRTRFPVPQRSKCPLLNGRIQENFDDSAINSPTGHTSRKDPSTDFLPGLYDSKASPPSAR